MRLAVLLLALATPAFGEGVLNGDQFEAYVAGKTLTYASEGEVYGVEQYLPGRRVRWAFVDDTCRIGHWYEEAGLICFVYEHDQTPQCWTFALEAGRLAARFMSAPGGTELVEVEQTEAPLACTGPDVGV